MSTRENIEHRFVFSLYPLGGHKSFAKAKFSSFKSDFQSDRNEKVFISILKRFAMIKEVYLFTDAPGHMCMLKIKNESHFTKTNIENKGFVANGAIY